MIFNILFTLSIRFFLFDFVLFKRLRGYLNNQGYIFKKLLHCPFCQGFWCGLGVYCATHTLSFTFSDFLSLLSFAFVTAYLSLLATAIFYPLIEKFEEKNDGIPLL